MTPRRPTPPDLLLASLARFLTACSADVSGTVSVSTRSGDVRRGADVQVLLVREQFMAQWTEASATYKANYRQAAVAYLEARARLQKAREDYARSRTGYRFPDRHTYEEAAERVREAAGRVEAVKKEWSEHTASLAQSATVKDARTDVNGRYEFKGVPRGKYYVMANQRMFATNLFWLVPVEVRGRQSVDFSSSNRSYPFDLIRDDTEMAKALAAPVSTPAPPETPHQPKWLAEELAKENQAVVAASLSKDECRTVANRVSNAARTSRDRRYTTRKASRSFGAIGKRPTRPGGPRGPASRSRSRCRCGPAGTPRKTLGAGRRHATE